MAGERGASGPEAIGELTMVPPASAVSAQQLAEFLGAVSAVPERSAAIRAAVEHAARVLDAEVAAVVCDGAVVTAVGLRTGRAPEAALTEVAAGLRDTLDVPGAGGCHAVAVPLHTPKPARLLVARSGADGFTVEERSLIRAMARVLELSLETLRTLAAERRQAAENARLLATLQARQRLLEQLSVIQRAIARRAPQQQIFDLITAGAQELSSDEAAGLRLLDTDDPEMLLLVSHKGLRPELARRLWRVPLSHGGAPGQAMLRDELVVIEGYSSSPLGLRDLADEQMQSSMAAPVHENGAVVGALVVGSYREGRSYTEADREVLLAFAEHVSLAVTDAKTLQDMHEAFHDSLTGLASRALFLDRLDHGLACAAREESQLAVLFVDLHRFKTVNDSMGHAAGDTLLIEVAQRLRSCLRDTDTAARLGGDEFAVLIEDLSTPHHATLLADRIIEVLRAPFDIRGKQVCVDASVGVAFNEPGDLDGEAMIQNADLAMQQAKKANSGCQVFEPAMQVSRQKVIELEANLRGAVERGEMRLCYQPIVDLASGVVTGVETLVRWHHPDRGIVPPLDFIPLAEETGLILPIGRWVLREACRQASVWNTQRADRPPLTLSVNLSALQLHQADLASTVAHALEEARLDPRCLILEITETVLLQDTDTDAVTQRLQALKALGVYLAIDDFGTGYSSLAYLRRFPVDILKIDKSFVDEVGHGSAASALARAIVNLGHTLQLVTVAEGIETAEQLVEVQDSGCRFGQGYYFARPLSAEDVQPYLSGATVAALPVAPDVGLAPLRDVSRRRGSRSAAMGP
jgi:diguanylate cyclase (GGDEF)-like protein